MEAAAQTWHVFAIDGQGENEIKSKVGEDWTDDRQIA